MEKRTILEELEDFVTRLKKRYAEEKDTCSASDRKEFKKVITALEILEDYAYDRGI